MNFSDTHDGQGSKLGKIAIVAALHVAVGAALVHSMNAKMFHMPKAMEEIVMLTLDAPPKPPAPPEPPKPKQQPAAVQPAVVAPPVEVPVPQQPAEPAIAASSTPEPSSEAGPATPDAGAATGKLFSAALADASGCAKPEYPPRAVRNGETGTVSLALLIGTDGRVSDSRIQHSSGSRELDRAAQAALSLCKFKPATSNGNPEPAWGKIAYVWTLD